MKNTRFKRILNGFILICLVITAFIGIGLRYKMYTTAGFHALDTSNIVIAVIGITLYGLYRFVNRKYQVPKNGKKSIHIGRG